MTLTWRPVLCSTPSQMPLSPCARSPGEGRAHAQTGFVEDGQQRWGRSWSRVLFPRTSGTGSAAPRPTRHAAGSGIPSFRTKHHWDSILAAPSDCGASMQLPQHRPLLIHTTGTVTSPLQTDSEDERLIGPSLVVQWLRQSAPSAGGARFDSWSGN